MMKRQQAIFSGQIVARKENRNKRLSRNGVRRIQFSLAPGITLRIGRSKATVQFNYAKNTFNEYFEAIKKLIPSEYQYFNTLDVTKSSAVMPAGLLPHLIAELAKAAARATPKDDAPTSK